MKMLVGNLTDPMMIINKGDRSDRIQFIKKYFKESMKSHGPYAMKFFFCGFLCLVNVIGQMYFTDRFLGYTFRNCDKTRRTLHSRPQHYQREDLRVPLVLVCGR